MRRNRTLGCGFFMEEELLTRIGQCADYHQLNLLGVQLLEQNQPRQAQYVFELAAKENKEIDIVYSNLVVSLRRQGKPREAIRLFDRPLTFTSSSHSLLLNLLNCCLDIPDTDSASRVMEELCKFSDSNTNLRTLKSMAIYFVQIQDFDEVKRIVGLMNELEDPEATTEGRLLDGLLLMHEKKFEEARDCFKFCVLHSKNKATIIDAENNLVAAIIELGDISKALETWNKKESSSRSYEFIENFSALAVCGITDCKCALDIDLPVTYPWFWMNRAISHFVTGETEKFHNDIRKIDEARDLNVIDRLDEKNKIFLNGFYGFLSKIPVPQHDLYSNSDNIAKTRWLFIGDSHTLTFHRMMFLTLDKSRSIEIVAQPIVGLKAFDVGLRVGKKYALLQSYIDRCGSDFDFISIVCGEIDCRPEEGIQRASDKKGCSASGVISDTVKSYIAACSELISQEKIIFFAPFSKPSNKPYFVHKARLVVEFNNQLKKFIGNDSPVFDLSPELGVDDFVDDVHLFPAVAQKAADLVAPFLSQGSSGLLIPQYAVDSGQESARTVMKRTPMRSITIDGTEYDVDQLSDNAKAQLALLQACENKVRQLEIDLAIVQTARQAYGLALKSELPEGETTTAANGDEPGETH